MSEKYGVDTVNFVTYVASTERDELGTATLTPKRTPVYGCRHRPVAATGRSSGREYPQPGVSISTALWQTTCPPHPAAMASKPQQNIEVNGVTFTIIDAPGPFKDGTGRPAKVTILSELQTTGH